ncbi:MAG: hypothetical protein PVI23_09170 [Maricaulaceae bacterium]|jgi:hypothetical protein
MDVTTSFDEPVFDADARAEIARVRDSGALGRSGRLLELFDFLVARSEAGAPPKEVEIAVSVFGKSATDDLRDDPIARVYVHRLRKRLDEYYASAAERGAARLDVPKGEYRIVHGALQDGSEAAQALVLPASFGPLARAAVRARDLFERRPGQVLIVAVAAVLALNAAVWALGAFVFSGARGDEIAQLRRHPVWAPIAGGDRPLVIAVGDYYMFGEYTDGIFLERLIRDFSVNSREDLLARQQYDPEAFGNYADVNLRYLPTSSAAALARVAPIAPHAKPTRVVLASELTPEMIRDDDIVYVGLFSALGPLRDSVFAASRFAFGDSYDEIVDTETGRTYRSDAFLTSPYDAMYSDYALFSSLEGPSGNRILVLAGARDAGLAGVAETLSRVEAADGLSHLARDGGSYEALYRIRGRSQVSIESELVRAAPVESARIWSAETPPMQFPAE